ncbi:MAG: hypothetical protein RIA71_08760 [Oceanicaulis sp.]
MREYQAVADERDRKRVAEQEAATAAAGEEALPAEIAEAAEEEKAEGGEG